MTIDRIRAIVSMASVLTALSGCTPSKPHGPDLFRAQNDIRERLSDAITLDGFSHGVRRQRDGSDHYDEININISISLDSLKGRHLSLEKLVTDIGRICAHPNYAHLPIRIFIRAGDDDDQMYLYAILATAVKGRTNIALVTATDSSNEIVVTVRHPSRDG